MAPGDMRAVINHHVMIYKSFNLMLFPCFFFCGCLDVTELTVPTEQCSRRSFWFSGSFENFWAKDLPEDHARNQQGEPRCFWVKAGEA